MKVLEWVVSVVTRWMKAGLSGRIEIHFDSGNIGKIIESTVAKPPL